MDKKHKRIYWVQKISLTDILRFSLQSRFVDIKVNYNWFQGYPLATRFLGFLEKARLNGIFFPVELTFDKKDAQGYALNYKVEKELNICIENLFIKYIPDESAHFKNMFKSYISVILKDNLKDKAIFITMVDSEIASKKAGNEGINTVYLDSHPFNRLLYDFYRDQRFDIKYPRVSLNNAIFYFRPLCYLVFFLLSKLSGSRVKNNISDIKPSIWVEYYPGRWHSFWMDDVKCEGFDIVSYLDRKDTPVTPEAIKEIESHNSKWIDAHLSALMKMSRLGFSAFKELFLELFLIPFSRLVWLGIFRFEYKFFLLTYESIFLRYKVKILIQHQEASWKQEAQALAVQRAGGIMVGYHWSAYPYSLMVIENFPQHVYFVWGKMMSELLSKKDSPRRYVLPSGAWMNLNGQSHERNGLFDKNVDFVISLFDSTVSYNSFQSPGSLSEFYLRILKVLKDHTNFGCVIKSKLPFYQSVGSLPSGREIIKDIEILKAQNRLAVLDSGEYPLAAAVRSDLSVGYGINSACIVSLVIDGHKAINWDCSGFKDHPFYKYPEQKVVFKTLDEIEEAILKVSQGDRTIGDYAFWNKQLNHFEDYSAINRMVNFLESYMKESIVTRDPEHSLDYAVKKYLSDNKVGEDFYQETGIWDWNK